MAPPPNISEGQDRNYFAILPKGLFPVDNGGSALDTIQPEAGPSTPAPTAIKSTSFLHLPHPRTGATSLYLPCSPHSAKGAPSGDIDADKEKADIKFLEVQRVAPEKGRSWFYGDYIESDGSLLLLTPISPLYLLIPLLLSPLSSPSSSSPKTTFLTLLELERISAQSTTNSTSAGNKGKSKRKDPFLPLEDLIESIATSISRSKRERARSTAVGKGKEKARDMWNDDVDEEQEDDGDVDMDRRAGNGDDADGGGSGGGEEDEMDRDVLAFLGWGKVRGLMKELCERQELAGQTYYRPSPLLILTHLHRKISALSTKEAFDVVPSLYRGLATMGLASLLEASRSRAEGNGSGTKTEHGNKRETEIKQVDETGIEVEMKVSVEIVNASVSVDEKAREAVDREEEILRLGRVKVAGEVVGQYLSGEVREGLMSCYDFTALDQHLHALSSLSFLSSHHTGSNPSSHMDAMMDMLEGADEGNGKGKKVAGGVGKKKVPEKGSRGVEALKKVNTSKMPKLTSFFKKKT